MIKSKIFYIFLIVLYLVFLTKDYLFKYLDNTPKIDSINDIYYKREYDRISKMLDIEGRYPDMIYSKVIFHDIYEFYNKITISKGSNDDLKEGNVIINNDGLVGVVSKTYNNYSEVKLLTNEDTNISVKINDSYGILTSVNKELYVKNIKLNNKINIHDLVYTSGLTDILEDILVGEVIDIKKSDLELEYIVKIKPSVDFYNLNYVGVLK